MKKKAFYELLLVVLFFTLVVFGVTIGLGTLTSGWHFIDDEEFLKYKYWMDYHGVSLLGAIKAQMQVDRLTRNNSLYYPFRIILFYCLGANAFTLSIEKAIETVIAMVLLYFCGKKLSNSVFISIFFSLTCYVGYQSAVWWKLGPPHVQATICFGISFLFLLKWLEKTEKNFYAVISFVFAIVQGYFHESFFMLIPFMGIYVIFDSYKKGDFNGVSFYKLRIAGATKQIWSVLGSKKVYVVSSFASFVFFMLVILLRLGLNSYDAVGVDSSTSVRSYIKVMLSNFDYDLKWYWIFGLLLFGVLLTFYEKLKSYIPEMLISLFIIFPQFVLYGKEGISERYILPLIIGYALFFVVFVLRDNFLSGKRKKIYIALLLFMLMANAHSMIIEGDYYRFRGQSATNALEQIEEMSSKGYNVMSCLGNSNPEADSVVEFYLLSKGKSNIYYWDQTNQKVVDYRPYEHKDEEEAISLSEVDVVVAYNRNDRHFEVEPNFDLSDYYLVRSGSVDIYYKNDAVSQVTEELKNELYVKPTIYGIGE